MDIKCRKDLLLKIPIGNVDIEILPIGEMCGYSTTLGKYYVDTQLGNFGEIVDV